MGLAMTLMMNIAGTVNAATVLWAALNESSTIDGTAFRTYTDSGMFVNSARLSIGGAGISQSGYSMDVVVRLPLWIPEWDGEPGYWEEDFPVVCLKDDDDDWYMSEWSSQFNLGDNPNSTASVFFELGYVDWNDDTAPFITLATATASVQDLIDGNYTYQSGSIAPPTERNWMPTQFHAVPAPSVIIMTLLGLTMLLKRRQQ